VVDKFLTNADLENPKAASMTISTI